MLRQMLRDDARQELDMAPNARLRQEAKTPSSQEIKLQIFEFLASWRLGSLAQSFPSRQHYRAAMQHENDADATK